MFHALNEITTKPDIFSVYTADTLWTEPHLATQMLETHLNQETPLASRPVTVIDRVVAWLDETFALRGKAVCDLGCGPGLYAERMAQRGARVTGLDFSANSLAHAERSAAAQGLAIDYRVANYLADPLPPEQDLVTLIYCDLCPLSPAQRATLLAKIHASLRPGGVFVFDVVSAAAFEKFVEQCTFAPRLMNGFWAAGDYHGFHVSHRYAEEMVTLDHFTIVEEARTWHVYNWLQHYTPASIEAEITAHGFEGIEIIEGLHRETDHNATFGVVARKPA